LGAERENALNPRENRGECLRWKKFMTKEDLEKQLEDLRRKWKIFPKSYLEPNWWKFKCDKCLAIQLKEQIKKIEAGQELTVSDLTPDQVENIFK